MASRSASTLTPNMALSVSRASLISPRASLSAGELQSKPLSELRRLARERGLRADTKAELIKELIASNGAVAAQAPAAPAAAAGAAKSAYEKQLEAMPLAQLRAIARSKGIFGSTRGELVKELVKLTPAASAPAPAASAAAPAAAAPSYTQPPAAAAPAAAAPASSSPSSPLLRELQTKPLSVLRAMARQKGLRGDTKAELVKALSAATPADVSSPPAAPSPPASAADPAQATPVVTAQTLARQLQGRPLSALRAMASAKGIQGGAAVPKDRLIRALIAAATTTAANISEVKADASVAAAALQAKPLSELRAMARERGMRGDTKAELVKLLSADSVPAFAAAAATPKPATFAAAAAAATATATATATALPPSATSASINLPFQSDVTSAGTTAIQPAAKSAIATEPASLREAMELFLTPDTPPAGSSTSANELADEAVFLRNVLVGAIGVAVLPLMLPMQMNQPAVVTAPVVPTAAVAPALPVAPPPEPEPEVREISPEEFCRSLPASMLSPQAAKFCEAVADMGL